MVGVSKITHTNQLSLINMHDKIVNTKIFKFRKFNLLISDCKIERYEPSLQTG